MLAHMMCCLDKYFLFRTMPLLSGSLTELVVLIHLLEPVQFLMRFNVMISLLKVLIRLWSTTLLQSKYYSFCGMFIDLYVHNFMFI